MKIQIVHNISQVRSPLKQVLENFLCREVPSLAWLHEKDHLYPGRVCYWLFFQEGSGQLVGVLRLTTKEFLGAKKPLIKKILTPAPPPEVWMGVRFPGVSGHGLITSPESEITSTQMILSALKALMKESPKLIQLTAADSLSLDHPLYNVQKTKHLEFKILSKERPLLPAALKEKIEAQKKESTEAGYRIVHIKDSHFISQILTEKMKGHLRLSCYQNLSASYLVLLKNDHPFTVVPMMRGERGHGFADIICNLDHEINSPFTLLLLREMMDIFDRSATLQTLSLIDTLALPPSIQPELPAMGFAATSGATYLISCPRQKKKVHRQPWTAPSP